MNSLERLQAARQGAGGQSALDRLMAARGGRRVEHGSMQPGEVRSLNGGPAQETGWQMPNLLPTPEGRAFLAESAAAVPQAVGDFARDQAGITGTHYRKLANVAGIPGVDAPTPEAEAAYNQAVIEGLMTAGGGMAGKAIGTKVSDAVKYLGRGFRTIPGAERFLASVPEGVGRAAASYSDLIGPALSGAVVGKTIDALDPGPHELVDDTIATGAGVTTAAAVGKNTIDDLLVGNPKWRDVMMRPSSGTASAILGGLLGYLASKGISATGDLVNEAADYVAGLFASEEQQ